MNIFLNIPMNNRKRNSMVIIGKLHSFELTQYLTDDMNFIVVLLRKNMVLRTLIISFFTPAGDIKKSENCRIFLRSTSRCTSIRNTCDIWKVKCLL